MSSQNRSVPRQPQSDSLIQAIHRVGGKHSRATAAAGTSIILYLSHLFITDRWICRFNHRINQVKMPVVPFSCFHRSSRYKHSGNVQPHGRHKHTRSYFVTVTDAYHRIRFMGIDHILHTIGYNITTWQWIEHSIVAHGNTVIDSNGIKFSCKASQLLYFSLHLLTYLVQVCVSGDKLGKRVYYCNNGFSHHFFLHAICHPKGSGPCHPATLCAIRAA